MISLPGQNIETHTDYEYLRIVLLASFWISHTEILASPVSRSPLSIYSHTHPRVSNSTGLHSQILSLCQEAHVRSKRPQHRNLLHSVPYFIANINPTCNYK